jgi:hypothetical protein
MEDRKGNEYTNRMRGAMRTLRNPTPIPVDIVQQKDHIELRVDSKGAFDRLPLASRMNFIAYLNALADIIQSEGSRANITGIRIG